MVSQLLNILVLVKFKCSCMLTIVSPKQEQHNNALFGLACRKFHNKHRDIAEESTHCNYSLIFGNVIVPTYDWVYFFSNKLLKCQLLQQFHFSASEPG